MKPHHKLVSILVAACFTTLLTPPTRAQSSAAISNPTGQAQSAPGVPFTPDKLATLLPPSVYFEGRSAPLQLRNAGGTTFANGAIVWVSLVDSSGYATGVQEKYQFYLVTELPLRIGEAKIPAGAYGGGFVGARFELMDLGGHQIAEGPVQTDSALRRPRPLQILPDSATSVKLVLGRHWVKLQAAQGE